MGGLGSLSDGNARETTPVKLGNSLKISLNEMRKLSFLSLYLAKWLNKSLPTFCKIANHHWNPLRRSHDWSHRTANASLLPFRQHCQLDQPDRDDGHSGQDQRLARCLPVFDFVSITDCIHSTAQLLFRRFRLLQEPDNRDSQFCFSYRGPVVMKGKPEPMKVYYLDRASSSAAITAGYTNPID